MTKMGASSMSSKMSGTSSSRSYRQITQMRRPAPVAAYISKEPSRRLRSDPTRSNEASTSVGDRPWASIFCTFHSIHLNRRIRIGLMIRHWRVLETAVRGLGKRLVVFDLLQAGVQGRRDHHGGLA